MVAQTGYDPTRHAIAPANSEAFLPIAPDHDNQRFGSADSGISLLI